MSAGVVASALIIMLQRHRRVLAVPLDVSETTCPASDLYYLCLKYSFVMRKG